MKYRVKKIDAAISQLDWAIRLFLDHKAYIPAITLAGAAEEIIGQAVRSESAFRKLMASLSAKYEIPDCLLSSEYLNKAKNWLKHWEGKKDAEYLDIELETEAIQYIVRAVANLDTRDKRVTNETQRFFLWLKEYRKDLTNAL